MTDGTFVKELKAAVQAPMQFGDRIIFPTGWSEQHKRAPLQPTALATQTLTGIRDALATLKAPELSLHVVSPTVVRLYGPLEDEAKEYRRNLYAHASVSCAPFKFGMFFDSEEFTISAMTQFAPSDDRARLLELVASVKDSSTLTLTDDGASQQVATQKGAVFSNRETVNNPFTLAPFRAFREVAQPESPFILRMRRVEGDRPKLALFECDGGAWELVAIQSVAEWLKANTTGTTIIA